MYNPSHFRAKSNDDVLGFMKAHPFVMICGVDVTGMPVATQVPILLEDREGKLYLKGHIQRKTDHHRAFEKNENVLVIFSGAHAYISASWYENKAVASTWNYQTVQAKGVLRFGDGSLLMEVLEKLTHHFENDPQSPALVSEMPQEYMAATTKAIIAFEIEITDLQHVFKLSQNKDEVSRANIIAQLDKSPNPENKAMAVVMSDYYNRN